MTTPYKITRLLQALEQKDFWKRTAMADGPRTGSRLVLRSLLLLK